MNALRPSRRARASIALLVALFVSVGIGRPALAHTEFDSSSPADAEVVDGPLSQITINFTNPANPSGDGFQVLDPTGAVLSPASVDKTDGTSFILNFDPPLAAGTYGVRWEVQAGDAHPIDGSFQFEVVGGTPATTAAPTTPATAAPTSPATAAPTTPTETTPATDAAPTTATNAAPSVPASTVPTSLDEFLNESSGSASLSAIGWAGRLLSMSGVIFGAGLVAGLIWTIRGSREELESLLNWARVSGFALITGGVMEYAALAERSTTTFGDLITSKPGLSVAGKIVGGILVVVGLHPRAGRFVGRSQSGDHTDGVSAPTDGSALRWAPASGAAVGLAGFAIAMISYWFEGHTASKGWWPLHAVLNSVHLAAAAVWAGGVLAMTVIAWGRRRREQRTGLGPMVVRFSSVATVSLIALSLAGVVMAWLVLDSPGDVFGTRWGQLLIAKLAVVAVAASMGAWNHFRLGPALRQHPDSPQLAKDLRTSLTVESIAMLVIVAVTAALVTASTIA